MDTPLVINIDTGAITFRTIENAEQCNCRPISHRHAKMVESGELDVKPLLAAIKKHMMSAEDFDYEKYADERRKLNVRHGALHADERAPVQDASADEYISDDEIDVDGSNLDAVESAISEVVAKPEKTKQSKTQKADAFPFNN